MGTSPAVGMTNTMPATASSGSTRALCPIAGVTAGNIHPRTAPSARTTITYSGTSPEQSCHRARPQRRTSDRASEASGARPAGGAAGGVTATARSARYAAPRTSTTPAATRSATQRHPSTNPMKIMVAGLRVGLPSQYATVAPGDARLARSTTATGAAQQLHIIHGTDAPPASTVLSDPAWPSARAGHSRGRRTCTAEPTSRPSTIACQMAPKYATVNDHAAGHPTAGGAAPEPVMIEGPMLCRAMAVNVL